MIKTYKIDEEQKIIVTRFMPTEEADEYKCPKGFVGIVTISIDYFPKIIRTVQVPFPKTPRG